MPPPRIPTPSLRKLSASTPLSHHHYRPYHSHEHTPPSPFPPTQTTILTASLPHIPTHGFTTTTLTHGAVSAGYPPVSTNLFPRGAFDLVHYHLVTARLSLRDRLRHRFPLTSAGEEASAWRAMGVGAKVKTLVLDRLRLNRERGVVGRWQEVCTLHRTFFFCFFVSSSRLPPSFLPSSLNSSIHSSNPSIRVSKR